jgi:hypothetical protein
MQENIQMKTTPRELSGGHKDQFPPVDFSSDALQANTQNSGNPLYSNLPALMAAPPFQFKSEIPLQSQLEEQDSLSA